MPLDPLVIRQLDVRLMRTFTCSPVHLTHRHHQKKSRCTRPLHPTHTTNTSPVINLLPPHYLNHRPLRQTTHHRPDRIH